MIRVTLKEFELMDPCQKDVNIPLVKHLFPLTTEKAIREVSMIWYPGSDDNGTPDWFFSYRWLACHVFDRKRAVALLDALLDTFPSITSSERREALSSNHALWMIVARHLMTEALWIFQVDLLAKLLVEQEKERPLFQRRHHKAIALALHGIDSRHTNPGLALAAMLKDDNPNFDREQFFKLISYGDGDER